MPRRELKLRTRTPLQDADGRELREDTLSDKTTNTTTHDVQEGAKSKTLNIEHATYAATEYDVYVPGKHWRSQAVSRFCNDLKSTKFTAATFNWLTGKYMHNAERMRIFRIIVKTDSSEARKVRAALQRAVGKLIAELSAGAKGDLEAIQFTETSISLTVSRTALA